jgi:DNA-binding CsgD family transcriptional regulator
MTTTYSLQQLGIPAITVNQFARITSVNRDAAEFFRLSQDETVGREWHSVVRSETETECCALCSTRRALRHGQTIQPIEMTVSTHDCCRRHVVVVPLPTSAATEGEITFLIIDESRAGLFAPVSSEPARPRVRELKEDRIIDELTVRERDILGCVVEGLDARGIASSLGISHATARNYVQRILTKLGARNKAEAVNVALTYNLLAS